MRSVPRHIAKATARRTEETDKARHTLAVQDHWASLTPTDRIKLMAQSANLSVIDMLAMIASRKAK